MDAGLKRLIDDYLDAVKMAVELLVQAGIPLPKSNLAWAFNRIPQGVELGQGIPYFKHGFGCTVYLPQKPVDFDFGDCGETSGFDAYRLSSFADKRLHEYGFDSVDAMNRVFEQRVLSGDLRYSGYLLYYLKSESN